jgi:hypothetical protein
MRTRQLQARRDAAKPEMPKHPSPSRLVKTMTRAPGDKEELRQATGAAGRPAEIAVCPPTTDFSA